MKQSTLAARKRVAPVKHLISYAPVLLTAMVLLGVPAAVSGAPLKNQGNTVMTEPPPTLYIRNYRTIQNHYWVPADPDHDNEMKSIQLYSGPVETVVWNSITVQADGTGNDELEIEKVRVYSDPDHDGLVESGSVLLGFGTYPCDNCALTIAISPAQDVGPSSTYVVIAYELKPTAPRGKSYYFNVTGATATGRVTGTPVVLDLLTSTSAGITVAPEPISIGQAKLNFPHVACLEDKVVTCISQYGNDFYMQEENRASGIKVAASSGLALQLGDRVTVVGRLDVWNSEAVFQGEVVARTPGTEAKPLLVANRSIGGAELGIQPKIPTPDPLSLRAYGPNNVGLLMSVTGRTGAVVDDGWGRWFTVDDGSGVKTSYVDTFGALHTVDGLRIASDSPCPCLGDIVVITGVSSVYALDTDLKQGTDTFQRVIRTRTPGDIQYLSTPTR